MRLSERRSGFRRAEFLLVALLVTILAALAGCSSPVGASNYEWDFSVVTDNLPQLLTGLKLTIGLSLVCMVLGLALGVVVAALRLSRFRVIKAPVAFYIEVMRSTPALVQIIWIFYCLPILTGINLSGVVSAVVAITLLVGAFYGEAFRSGIQSTPVPQLETARTLGLTYVQSMRYVVLPHAIRAVLPVLVSNTVLLIKDTSLVSAIGVADLMYSGNVLATTYYRPLEFLTTVGFIYLVLIYPLTALSFKLERRLRRDREG